MVSSLLRVFGVPVHGLAQEGEVSAQVSTGGTNRQVRPQRHTPTPTNLSRLTPLDEGSYTLDGTAGFPILLDSVAQRTAEIGLRKALGHAGAANLRQLYPAYPAFPPTGRCSPGWERRC